MISCSFRRIRATRPTLGCFPACVHDLFEHLGRFLPPIEVNCSGRKKRIIADSEKATAGAASIGHEGVSKSTKKKATNHALDQAALTSGEKRTTLSDMLEKRSKTTHKDAGADSRATSGDPSSDEKVQPLIEAPRLSLEELRPPILFRGKLAHVRDLDFGRFQPMLADSLLPQLNSLHLPIVSLFQAYLDAIDGLSCPTFEENVALADSIRVMADAFGIGMFRGEVGGFRQVRVYCDGAEGYPTGRFLARPTDRQPPQTSSAVWPRLIAKSLASTEILEKRTRSH